MNTHRYLLLLGMATLLIWIQLQKYSHAVEVFPVGTLDRLSDIFKDGDFAVWDSARPVYELYEESYLKILEEVNALNTQRGLKGLLQNEGNSELHNGIETLGKFKNEPELTEAVAQLLSRFPSDYEQGQILYMKAKRSLLLGFDGAEQAAQEALTYALWPGQEIDIYRLIGQTRADKAYATNSKELFTELRAKSAAAYLEGLHTRYMLPEWPTLPPLPALMIERIMLPPNASDIELSAAREAVDRRNQLFSTARKFKAFVKNTISLDEYLKEQVVGLYTREPINLNELERLATDILNNPALERELLDAVRSSITPPLIEQADEALAMANLENVDMRSESSSPPITVEPIHTAQVTTNAQNHLYVLLCSGFGIGTIAMGCLIYFGLRSKRVGTN